MCFSDVLRVVSVKVFYLVPPHLHFWLFIVPHIGLAVLYTSICHKIFCILGWFSCFLEDEEQHNVSQSSTEAEYCSIAMTLCELKWYRHLLHDLRVPLPWPISLYCNSQTALHIATNPVFHKRMKYIEIDCHFMMPFKLVFFLHITFIVSCNLLTFSQKLLSPPSFIS